MNIVNKATGDSLTATEFNQIPDELETLISSANINPSELDLTQVSKSVAQIVAEGSYFITSGTANAIVLDSIAPRKPITNLSNGISGVFKANLSNTSTATLNICNTGAKPILLNSNPLQNNDIQAGEYYSFIYDSTSDSYEIGRFFGNKTFTEEYINVEDYGCVGDANYLYNGLWYKDSSHNILATDNSTNLQRAITDADSRNLLLNLNGKKYRSSTNIIMNKRGIISNGGGIVGGDCIISCVQPYFTQGILYCDKLYLCGSYLSEYDKLFVYGDIIFKGNGYNGENYGFFWNKFRSIECHGKMLFDMDGGHSINQNLFENVRVWGGVHIKGTSTVVGKTSCNSNMFVNLDTSGANITAEDGTTGYQVLNESWANQCNIIQNWYSEDGRCGIRGKWNILGSAQLIPAGRNGGLTIDRTNHCLFTIPSDTRMTCDFFAGTPVNKLLGGNWKYLGHKGQPLGIRFRNVDFEVIGVDGAPDGNPYALKVNVRTNSFSGISIQVPVATHDTFNISMYCKILNAPDFYTVFAKDGGSFYATDNLIPVGNGWYLMRLTGLSRTATTTYNLFTGELFGDGKDIYDAYNNFASYFTSLTINLNSNYDSSALEKPTIIIGSIFVSTEQSNFLPQFEQGPKEARSTAIPTGGIWKYGDRCYNSIPTAGQPMGWICTTSGDYRTLSDVTGSITSGTKELTVNDASNLYIGANINIAGVTGNKIVMNKVDNVITIDSNADATVTDGAISYVTPVWASMGNLS